jgi:hypothetical protein
MLFRGTYFACKAHKAAEQTCACLFSIVIAFNIVLWQDREY